MIDSVQIVYWGNPRPIALRRSAQQWQPLVFPRTSYGLSNLTLGLTRSPSGTVWIAGDVSTILRPKLPSVSRVSETAEQKTTEGVILTSGTLVLPTPSARAWLYDLTGRCIRSWHADSIEVVEISDVPTGFYAVMLESRAGLRTCLPIVILE